MLYILTGDIQIGKTRWLMRLLGKATARMVTPYGVTSPGIWHRSEGQGQDPTYEKVGIETVFLPDGQTKSFAKRKDIALAEGSYDTVSQSAQAQLGWAIEDDAITHVNEHFDKIAAACNDQPKATEKGLLVVDELGRLELLRGEGFTSAVSLLEQGQTKLYANALIVVRSGLVEKAQERFDQSWTSTLVVEPSDVSETKILATLTTG